MSTLPKPENIKITSDVKSWARKKIANCDNQDDLVNLVRSIADESDALPYIHYLLTPSIQTWGAKTKDFKPTPSDLMPALYRASEYSSRFDNFCYLAHYMKDNFTTEECSDAFSGHYGERVMREMFYYHQSEYSETIIDMFDLPFSALEDQVTRIAERDADLFEKCVMRYGQQKVFDCVSLPTVYLQGDEKMKSRLMNFMSENSETDKVQATIANLFKDALKKSDDTLLKQLLSDDFKPDFDVIKAEDLLSYDPDRIADLKKAGYDLYAHLKTTPTAVFEDKIGDEESEIGSGLISTSLKWMGNGIDVVAYPDRFIHAAIDHGKTDFLRAYFEKSDRAGDFINEMMMPFARDADHKTVFKLVEELLEQGVSFKIENAPLKRAIENNEPKSVKKFLSMKHYDLSEPEMPAMLYAYMLKKGITIEDDLKAELLNCEMDASANKSALLRQAIDKKDYELISYCFEHGADIMADNDNIMHEALYKNDVKIMQLVYKHAKDDLLSRSGDWRQYAYHRDKYKSRDFIRDLPAWKLVGDDEVSRTTHPIPDDHDKKLTQVFNFAAKTVTTLFVNSSDKTSNMEVINFSQFQNDADIQNAFNMLVKMGGSPDVYDTHAKQLQSQNRMHLTDVSQKKSGIAQLSIKQK